MKNKKFITLLSSALLMACMGINNNYINVNDDPTVTKSFTLNGAGTLNVTTSGGGIEVSGHENNTVVVNAYIRKNGRLLPPDDELVTGLSEGYELTISQNGNEINAKAKQVKNNMPWRQISISFKITVPHEMTSVLHTSGGGVKIADLIGEQQLTTSGGGITIRNITGKVKGNTSGGGITVENNQGDIDISTSGGGITIENSNGNVVASTSGGGIKLENITGKADVRTSGGSIKLSGEMHNVSAKTSGGGIRADLTGVSEKLYLKTSGGSIQADLPSNLGMDLDLKGNHVNIGLVNFNGTAKKDAINGSMNGGGIPVYMHTSGGGVNVNFK